MAPRFALLLLLLGACQAAPPRGDAPSPSFLIILPDQLRAQALGCMGDRDIRTPHLDALAKEGLLFRNMFANTPVCCPARAVLLTGRYAHANGMVANDLRFRESEVTIAEILREKGYRTGFIGKWHLYGARACRVPPARGARASTIGRPTNAATPISTPSTSATPTSRFP
jgi:arylsulfatase A-like enzyme